MKNNWVVFAFSLTIFVFSSITVFSQTFTEISGTVTKRGVTIPGANVGVSNIRGTLSRTTVSDNRGFFQFTMLPVDRYIVRVFFSGSREKRFEVTTGIGQTSVLDIELEENVGNTVGLLGSITGKVTDKDDKVIDGGKLSYAKKDDLQNKIEIEIDEDGEFNILELPAGKYILFFEAEGFKPKRKEVRVRNKEKRINLELSRK